MQQGGSLGLEQPLVYNAAFSATNRRGGRGADQCKCGPAKDVRRAAHAQINTRHETASAKARRNSRGRRICPAAIRAKDGAKIRVSWSLGKDSLAGGAARSLQGQSRLHVDRSRVNRCPKPDPTLTAAKTGRQAGRVAVCTDQCVCEDGGRNHHGAVGVHVNSRFDQARGMRTDAHEMVIPPYSRFSARLLLQASTRAQSFPAHRLQPNQHITAGFAFPIARPCSSVARLAESVIADGEVIPQGSLKFSRQMHEKDRKGLVRDEPSCGTCISARSVAVGPIICFLVVKVQPEAGHAVPTLTSRTTINDRLFPAGQL